MPTSDPAERQEAIIGVTTQEPAKNTFSLDEMDGHVFQDLIARLLAAMTFEIEDISRSADGGVDVVARSREAIKGGLFLIQCKRQSSKVGEPVVRDLYGVMHHRHASKGILITNCDFTRQAIAFADGKPIELINGEQLIGLLRDHGLVPQPPEGKNIVVVNPLMKRFSSAYQRAAERIRDALERDDLVVAIPKKEYAFGDFWELAQSSWADLQVTEGNITRVTKVCLESISSQQADNRLIDVRFRAIDEGFNDILKARENLRNAKLDDRFGRVKASILLTYDSVLRSYLDTANQSAAFVAMDGSLVDENASRRIVIDQSLPDFDKIMAELQAAFDEIASQGKAQKDASGPCFVATCVYGGQAAWQVNEFRRFRDEFLIGTRTGRIVVGLYYRIGPCLANAISHRPRVISAARAMLDAFLVASRRGGWLTRRKTSSGTTDGKRRTRAGNLES